jgi:hypothetical protein
VRELGSAAGLEEKKTTETGRGRDPGRRTDERPEETSRENPRAGEVRSARLARTELASSAARCARVLPVAPAFRSEGVHGATPPGESPAAARHASSPSSTTSSACKACMRSEALMVFSPLACCESAHCKSFSVVCLAPPLNARFCRFKLEVYRAETELAAARNRWYSSRSISSRPVDSALRFLGPIATALEACVLSFRVSRGGSPRTPRSAVPLVQVPR